MPPVRLILALHNHQPLGSPARVFEHAYETSYRPFLDVMEKRGEIPFAMHTSGPLLEWLVEERPEYVDRLRGLVECGQVEIMGGGFFEPIMTMIPHRDRVGQIRAFTDYVQELFPTQVRGIWLAEQAWEQSLVTSLADAGIEYTVLGDRHFEHSGSSVQDRFGYYLTEDQGHLLKVFPSCETLRYSIPFAEPLVIYEFLKRLADRRPRSTVVFAGRGEKLGALPETFDHVYTNGWLERFCDMVLANRDWLEPATFATAIEDSLPLGKAYPSANSYREMKVRYPESDEMYARMLGISARLAAAQASSEADPDYLEIVRDGLYRGQCNDAYRPGPWGGVYLPYQRDAVYRHLIAAHNALDELEGRTGPRIQVAVGDFNLDGRKEVRLENDRLIALIRPAQGGHVYELDVRESLTNVLATLDRRPEPYHRDEHLIYDRHPRKALVDHFFPIEATLEALVGGRDLECGDFVLGTYHAKVQREPGRSALIMERAGQAGDCSIRMRKTIALSAGESTVLVRYEIEGIPRGGCLHFGVEINLAGTADNARDRFYSDGSGANLGLSDSSLDLPHASGLSLTDRRLDLSVALAWSQSAGVWCFPIETVCQSEVGLERTCQSSAVIPHWHISPDDQGRWEVEIRWSFERVAGHGGMRRGSAHKAMVEVG